MANNRTLTAANSIILLGVRGLYDTPQQIQGFSADNVADLEAFQPTETQMGVDGRLSAGWAAAPVVQNVTLQADSESNDFFENWIQSEQTAREKFVAFGTIILPATDRKYSLERGFLGSVMVMPAIQRTLQPRRYSLTWQRVTPAPY